MLCSTEFSNWNPVGTTDTIIYLKRSTALTYSFEKFTGYEFEVYGVEDYLADFYHAGRTVHEMKDNIRVCDEKEIGFSFMFPFEVDGKQIFEFVKLLRREGFYY